MAPNGVAGWRRRPIAHRTAGNPGMGFFGADKKLANIKSFGHSNRN